MFLECGTVRVLARTRSRGVPCSDCSVLSSRVHSTYERRLADTPVGGQPVLVELTVRRLSWAPAKMRPKATTASP
ncbi:transposase family protein [Streptomyces sp. NPDC051577]|uniref:transposase family protein n=1 Tax=Streptomyces sp. NPDC051577 TaxID=3155166 RepID=UPI0034280D65